MRTKYPIDIIDVKQTALEREYHKLLIFIKKLILTFCTVPIAFTITPLIHDFRITG